MHGWNLVFGSLMVVAGSAGAAKPVPTAGADAAPLAALAQCRGIADDAGRLACYDASAGALLAAEKRADVIVVERAEVEQSRRSLFGLSLPDMTLFKRHGAPVEAIDRVDGEIASVSTNSSGQLLFRLRDGASWQQIDSYSMGRTPRSGDPVVIRRAALGSFRLSVAGGNAVRVHRVN